MIGIVVIVVGMGIHPIQRPKGKVETANDAQMLHPVETSLVKAPRGTGPNQAVSDPFFFPFARAHPPGCCIV